MNRLKRNFFEGWYIKNSDGKNVIAFIPSYHVDNAGVLNASLQIISNDSVYSFRYAGNEFTFLKKPFFVKIGDSEFTDKGITVRAVNADTVIEADLTFGTLIPPKYDVMGPFSTFLMPNCRHSVLSLSHTVNGTIKINNKKYSFDNAKGYIESDSGRSFPEKYLWTQCETDAASVMLSIATVKTLSIKFLGTICIILYRGKEHRLASYLGAKVIFFDEKTAIIKQGKCSLTVNLLCAHPHNLDAPVDGLMKRIIKESPAATVRYVFKCDDNTIFDIVGTDAGFEYSDTDNITTKRE